MADEGYWGKSPEEVLSQLVDIYQSDLLRLCFMVLHDRTMAEDAVQETFIKAYRNLSSFRGECSVKTWLTRIAVNTCRDMLRSGWFRLMRRSQPVETLFSLSAPGDLQEEAAVRDAVLRLPGMYREVVVLYYDQDMKIREIAEVLGLSQNSASTRLRRAKALLAKELKGGSEE